MRMRDEFGNDRAVDHVEHRCNVLWTRHHAHDGKGCSCMRPQRRSAHVEARQFCDAAQSRRVEAHRYTQHIGGLTILEPVHNGVCPKMCHVVILAWEGIDVINVVIEHFIRGKVRWLAKVLKVNLDVLERRESFQHVAK